MLDKKDHIILSELQHNADQKIHQLERSTKLPRSTIHNRIKKLKKDNTITKVKAIVNPEALGLTVCALVHIVISHKGGVHKVANRLSHLPNVEETYITAGVFDIIIKARFKDNKALADFIFNDKTGIKAWEGIERTESMLCLETIKENGVLEKS